MKKFAVLLFVMLASISIKAQEANPNEKLEAESKKWVTEMNQAITLSETEQKQIYDIDLAKRIKFAEFRKENAGNQPVIKEKVTELNKAAFAEMKKIVGDDRWKMWNEYRKAQKANK
jgi:MoxR-like ATPase